MKSAAEARSGERVIPRALPAVRVIGVGRTVRGDDGAGPRVARALAAEAPEGVSVTECPGEFDALLDLWEGADAVLVVDAVRTGGSPGTLVRFDAIARRVPAPAGPSSHGFGLAEAIEYGRALRRLPRVLIVHGVEAADVTPGAGLSPAVAAALPALLAVVRAEALGLARSLANPGQAPAVRG
jgi:hydrogenase maturation protease